MQKHFKNFVNISKSTRRKNNSFQRCLDVATTLLHRYSFTDFFKMSQIRVFKTEQKTDMNITTDEKYKKN